MNHDTEDYEEYELKEKMGAEDFDKMQAYKIANGQVNANPLVDKDGMINHVFQAYVIWKSHLVSKVQSTFP